MSQVKLNWQGKQLLKKLASGLSDGLVEFDHEVAEAAKAQLWPGHGVETRTLKRSIHGAAPDYNWRGDNVTPSDKSPERGRRPFKAKVIGNKIMGVVGSGMVYAMAIHQGFESFAGYHYITTGLQKKLSDLPRIFQRNMQGD